VKEKTKKKGKVNQKWKYLARECTGIHCTVGRRYYYLAGEGEGLGYDVYNNVDPAIDQSCVCFSV
jgi:hypothetical protein